MEVYPTAAALGQACADAVQACLAEGIAGRGQATLVATGGRAPGPVYDALGAAHLDWASVVVTLSDERCVEAQDPQSNARLVRDRLLQGDAAQARFLPLWPQPEEAALAALLPFDAVLLGMGEDGHVASLIPGSPALAQGLTTERLSLAVPAGAGSPPLARITLSLAALMQARAIFLLIAGAAKREVLARARAGEDLPVGRLLGQDQAPVRVFWAPSHEE